MSGGDGYDPMTRWAVASWGLTAALLLVFGFGVYRSSALGGVANAALVAGAVMMLVSLVLGRRVIASPRGPARSASR